MSQGIISRRNLLEQGAALSAVIIGGSYPLLKNIQSAPALPEVNPVGAPLPVQPQQLTLNHQSAKVIEAARQLEQPIKLEEAPLDVQQASLSLQDTKVDVISDPEAGRSLTMQQRVSRFDENLEGDVQLPAEQMPLLKATLDRINRVQKYVGYGNFNVLTLDEMLAYANRAPSIGAFTKQELDFIEQLFHQDARTLGFYGDKVVDKMTVQFPQKDVVKVAGSGHFLFKGESEKHFQKLQQTVGEDLVLTSGIRSLVKQYQLFLAKAVQTNGNMSRASRSLAPPGYSYHALGDFDVGQVNYGKRNFTSSFADSDVYKKLTDLGYIKIRYTMDNKFGVRFEPWHIRVV